MKSNYFETILGFLTVLISTIFLAKLILVNTNSSSEKFYDLNAKFLEVGGLKVGNDVKMSGVKIGVVNKVYLDNDFLANVEFKVFSNIKIPKESVVSIGSDGLLGNKYLSVNPENRQSKTYLQQGDDFVNIVDFESIEDQVSKIIFWQLSKMKKFEEQLWIDKDKKVISCIETNKVLNENFLEVYNIIQSAMDDAILMGCDEKILKKN